MNFSFLPIREVEELVVSESVRPFDDVMVLRLFWDDLCKLGCVMLLVIPLEYCVLYVLKKWWLHHEEKQIMEQKL